MRKGLRRIRAVGGLLLSALLMKSASGGWGEVLAITTTFALASASMK